MGRFVMPESNCVSLRLCPSTLALGCLLFSPNVITKCLRRLITATAAPSPGGGAETSPINPACWGLRYGQISLALAGFFSATNL